MSQSYPDSLSLSRKVLRVLIRLNQLFGAFILAMLVASIVAAVPFMTALGAPPTANNPMFVTGMRAIMVIGMVAVLVTNIVLTRLHTIVESVGVGNPFVKENADRLQTIAWSVLVLELMDFAVGTIAQAVSSASAPLDIKWDFSFTPWLAVLLLFVLARVFEQGARMREDLEGTV